MDNRRRFRRNSENGHPRRCFPKASNMSKVKLKGLGERHEDAQDFIDRCMDKLHNRRILESHRVDFITFQLEGRARRWWQSYVLGRPTGSPPLTSGQFTQLFLDRYIPPSEREELRYQFEHLEQGQMSVTDYEARFFESSRHALMILPTDAERVRRFVAGLHPGILASMAREVDMGTEYQLVIEIACRIEVLLPESAIPESSYHLLAIQGSFSGYSDKQAMPPKGGGHASRVCPRGGGQAGRGQSTTSQSGGSQPAGAPARFYALPARPDALASDSVITGIISVCGRDPSVLFDPGSTYSYVSSLFARFLVIPPTPLGTPVHVSTPMGNSVVVDWIYRSCVVTLCGFETIADLMLLDMIDFEIIMGMDWLSPYHTVLDCHAKTITLAMPGLPRLEWKGSTVDTSSRVISFLKASHMVEKGCLAYLAYVRDTTA
ncbi:uncharacterized protein [Nicotiana sylvestris]|uniref:uncharacterized protein n=1 Tax=Nicotiana sylvestris TaxID=4096 RepID=UPI00388CE748